MNRTVATVRSFLLLALAVGAVSAPQVRAADPCCSIVAVDKDSGLVTLRDNKSGKIERVTVRDRAKLAQLTPGQQADRSIGQRIRYCSITTFEPCIDQVRSHDCQPCPN